MPGKLLVLILWVGLVACALLALRQSRLQYAHELAQIQLRIARHDEALWRERVRIARGVTPARVQEMAARLGPLRPFLTETGQTVAGGERGRGTLDDSEKIRADASPARRDVP
jgi:hypothetical protein